MYLNLLTLSNSSIINFSIDFLYRHCVENDSPCAVALSCLFYFRCLPTVLRRSGSPFLSSLYDTRSSVNIGQGVLHPGVIHVHILSIARGYAILILLYLTFANSVTLAEDTAVGTILSTVIATTDADNGLDGSVSYSIVSGGGILFDIVTDKGNVTLVSSLDRETAQTHVVIIRAADAGTNPAAKSATATLTVSVTDVNDVTPTCAPSVVAVSLAESMAAGSAVVALSCSDADLDPNNANNVVGYAFSTGNAAAQFVVNPTSGQLSLSGSAALDYESTKSYSLTVNITDNGTPTLSNEVSVTVSVTGTFL